MKNADSFLHPPISMTNCMLLFTNCRWWRSLSSVAPSDHPRVCGLSLSPLATSSSSVPITGKSLEDIFAGLVLLSTGTDRGCWDFQPFNFITSCKGDQTYYDVLMANTFKSNYIIYFIHHVFVSCSEPHQDCLQVSWKEVVVVSFFKLPLKCPDKTPFFAVGDCIFWQGFSASQLCQLISPLIAMDTAVGRNPVEHFFLRVHTSCRAEERTSPFPVSREGLEE